MLKSYLVNVIGRNLSNSADRITCHALVQFRNALVDRVEAQAQIHILKGLERGNPIGLWKVMVSVAMRYVGHADRELTLAIIRHAKYWDQVIKKTCITETVLVKLYIHLHYFAKTVCTSTRCTLAYDLHWISLLKWVDIWSPEAPFEPRVHAYRTTLSSNVQMMAEYLQNALLLINIDPSSRKLKRNLLWESTTYQEFRGAEPFVRETEKDLPLFVASLCMMRSNKNPFPIEYKPPTARVNLFQYQTWMQQIMNVPLETLEKPRLVHDPEVEPGLSRLECAYYEKYGKRRLVTQLIRQRTKDEPRRLRTNCVTTLANAENVPDMVPIFRSIRVEQDRRIHVGVYQNVVKKGPYPLGDKRLENIKYFSKLMIQMDQDRGFEHPSCLPPYEEHQDDHTVLVCWDNVGDMSKLETKDMKTPAMRNMVVVKQGTMITTADHLDLYDDSVQDLILKTINILYAKYVAGIGDNGPWNVMVSSKGVYGVDFDDQSTRKHRDCIHPIMLVIDRPVPEMNKWASYVTSVRQFSQDFIDKVLTVEQRNRATLFKTLVSEL